MVYIGKHNNLFTEDTVITNIMWKEETLGDTFNLYIVVGDKEYFVGEFCGINLWEYKEKDAPEYVLYQFRALWTGIGSDFYFKYKSDTELAIMYHFIRYKSEPADWKWENYEEVFVIPIEEGSDIKIGKSVESK